MISVEEAKNLIVSGNLTQYSSEKCKSWIYDKEEHVTTMVTERDLVWLPHSPFTLLGLSLFLLVGPWQTGLDVSPSCWDA